MSPRLLRIADLACLLALVAAGAWLATGIVALVRDAAGPNRLEVPLAVERPAIAEVFYDCGAGIRQEDSARGLVAPSDGATELKRVALELPRKAVTSLRLDPIAFEGKFAVGAPRLVSASGRELARVPLEAVRPQNQIAEWRREGTRWVGTTTPDANDPQLAVDLAAPLPAGNLAWPWARVLLTAALGAGAWRLGRRAENRAWRADVVRIGAGVLATANGKTVAAGAALVGAAEFARLWPLHRALDWPLWDEVNYAAAGAAWAHGTGPLGELHSAPLFMASYGLWSRLGGLATAIFAQHYFVKVASTVLLYLVLARWWRSWGAAAGVALAWGATQFQTEFPLLVYQSAWVWFLAALAVVDRWPLAGLGLATMAVGGRQEYQFAAAGLALWLAWRTWRGGAGWRELVATEGGAQSRAVGVGLAVAAWGVVAAVGAQTSLGHSEGRAWFAFQQHYAVRAVETGEVKGINPWLDYPRVVEKDFGAARSLGEAWRANAAAVTRHVGSNLRMAPVEIARLGEIHAGFGVAAGLLVIGAAGLLVAGARSAGGIGEDGRGEDRGGHGVAALPASAVLAATAFVVVTPGLLVLAKGAYLLPVVPAIVGAAGWGLRRSGRGVAWLAAGGAALVVAGVVTAALAPKIFVPGDRARAVAATMTELEKRWPRTGRAALLGAGASSYAHYLGDARCEGVEPFSETSGVAGRSASLADLLARYRPRAVLVTADWRQSARFDETEIARRLAAPEWERREVAAGEIYWRTER